MAVCIGNVWNMHSSKMYAKTMYDLYLAGYEIIRIWNAHGLGTYFLNVWDMYGIRHFERTWH